MNTSQVIVHDDGWSSEDEDLPVVDISITKLSPEEALKCLTGQCRVIVPTPTSKPCNNLNEYFSRSVATPAARKPVGGSSSKKPDRPSQTGSFSSQPFSVPLVRNFERILKRPNESGTSFTSTIQTARPSRRLKTDVFTRAEQIDLNAGPLSHLRARINQSIKVTIRRRRKVPFISRVIDYKGTLLMFDKHMNLYLKDVIESFAYSIGDKTYKRARHRDGIVVRGDNVIMVV